MPISATQISVSELDNTDLQKFVRALLADGLKVYVTRSGTTYCHFTDGVNIGYAQFDWQGVSLSTVHKPNRFVGTGFNVLKGCWSSADDARRAFALAPSWASESDRRQVKKYSDFESFAKSYWTDLIEVK